MTSAITHGHVLACPCCEELPDLTWAWPPHIHMINCATCGAFLQGEVESEVADRWNAIVAQKADAA
jgi:Zn ribbon nucleic-acid-binding protein